VPERGKPVRRITFDLPWDFVERWDEAARRTGYSRRASLLEAIDVWIQEVEAWEARQKSVQSLPPESGTPPPSND